MKLFYSVNSPFARKCRVVAMEKDLQGKIVFVEVNPLDNPEELLLVNPLGTVPALQVDEGTPLCESPLICEYLDTRTPHTPLFPKDSRERFSALRLAALADGVTTAAVTHVVENRRPEEKHFQEWILRKEKAITRTISVLSHMVEERDGLHIGSIALAVALNYVSFRLPHIDWRLAHGTLADWVDEFSKRPSMQATKPKA